MPTLTMQPKHFTSETARAAINKRWAKNRMISSQEYHQKEVNEYAAAKGLSPDQVNPNLFFASVMADEKAPLDHRIIAAKQLQPYFNGAPPKEAPAESSTPSDPAMDEKRARAYDFMLGLIKQSEQSDQSIPLPNGDVTPPSPTDLDAEPVPAGEEYKPGLSPLSTEIIDDDG